MSQVSPTIKENAAVIKQQLESYAHPRGGHVKVVANMRHLWEEIYQVSDSPRILICYTGENARGEYAGGQRTNLHRVDRQWTVVVIRGHGFNDINPARTQEIEDFYDSVETVRDGIRVLADYLSAEDFVDYKTIRPLPGIAPTQTANVFMDAYAIEFATAADIPEIKEDGTAV